MDTYKLGELPEPLGAWAKFRPADDLDFSRRAKNLAALLKLPLQKTQDAFAIACGYSGKHELQQILAQAGTPGPYDDTMPTEILEEIDDAQAIVQFYRHSRLLTAIDGLIRETPERWFQNRDTTVCDLDIFSTPARHRAAARGLTQFLDGGSGCTFDGFPYGYRGTLHARYISYEPTLIDEAALKELEDGWALEHPQEERPFDPRVQARALLRYRAPVLFVEMAKATASLLIADPPELDLDFDFGLFDEDTDLSKWLLIDFDFHLACCLSEPHGVDPEDEEFDRLITALSTPVQDVIAASSVAAAIADFANQIPRWRLSLRYQWATALCDPEFSDWGDGGCGPTLMLDSFIQENSPELENANDKGPTRWLSVCMQKQHLAIDQIHWRVSATLFVAESGKSPWKAVALLTGDHIIGANDRGYAGTEEVALYHDDVGNARLLQVWKILVSLYLPVAGYLTYHEWVNNLWEGGGIVAVLDPWVAPKHRGSDVSRWLLEGYARAFDDGSGYCSDSLWRTYVDPRLDDMDMGMHDDDDTQVFGPGVLFIPLPGSRMLGYSVWETDRDEPRTKILRLNGDRVGPRSRWGRGEPIRGGLGPHFLEVAKKIEADIVLFDPNDAGDEGDEGDEGDGQ